MERVKEPDINDPKYKYFHKKVGRYFVDNERYFFPSLTIGPAPKLFDDGCAKSISSTVIILK